eukprot:TRINITY_DN6273_c0_g1_i1.p1 TRINITY_DN6273_c0_g1~~TRINITY_DN6273_c0_g1_i1.p1  ORF type:complete len:263 (-),score=33.86 TRINITY_DN6273_c0_g1_i1:5-736(-)
MDQQEAEDIETMKEMVWTVVIIVYLPATTKSVEELIAKMDGVDQDNLHFIEPKFNKHDVIIIQSNNWPDIRRVAATLNSILGRKVECILSLEKEVANETYRSMIGFLQTNGRTKATSLSEEMVKLTLEEAFRNHEGKEITYIQQKNVLIISFRNPRDRLKATEDKTIMNEGTKQGKYKVMLEGTMGEMRVFWRSGPVPEGTHPFQLTFGNGKDMGTQVRNNNIESPYSALIPLLHPRLVPLDG